MRDEFAAAGCAACGGLGVGGVVDVRPFALVSRNQPLLEHHLQHAQDAGVGDITLGIEHLMDLFHGGWAQIPQHPQKTQFDIRGAGCSGQGDLRGEWTYSNTYTKYCLLCFA